MRTLITVCIVAAAAPAFADDCDFTDAAGGTGATEIAHEMDAACQGDTCGDPAQLAKMLPDYQPPAARGRHGKFATAEATIGTLGEAHTDGEALSSGELAASGQAGWHSGPRVCARTDIVAGTTSRGDTAFRIASPWPMFSALSFGVEQKWQLRPRLDDSRIYLRRLYSSTEIEVGVGLITLAHIDGGSASVFPVRMTVLMQDQDRTGAQFRSWRLGLYESIHADRRTEILPFSVEAMYPYGAGTDQDPAPATAWINRLDLVDLQRRYGDVSVEVGGGYVAADRPIAVPVAASVAVAYRGWSLRAERDAHLAMDQSITIEDRLSAAYRDGRWRAGAFAALTHTTNAPDPQLTGGGSAGLDVALPEKLKMSLDVEVARSYYARLDGDPTPTPELAGTGTVRLERHFNVNPTAR